MGRGFPLPTGNSSGDGFPHGIWYIEVAYLIKSKSNLIDAFWRLINDLKRPAKTHFADVHYIKK